MHESISLKNTTYNFFNQLELNSQINLNKAEQASSEQIESLFVNLMIKSMRAAHLENNLLNNEQIILYESIYDQILSDKVSTTSIGLKNFFNKYLFKRV